MAYIYIIKKYIYFFDIFNSTRSISQLIDPAFGWGGFAQNRGKEIIRRFPFRLTCLREYRTADLLISCRGSLC